MATMTFEDTPEIVALRERVRTIIGDQVSPEFLRTFVASAEWQATANEFCRRLASDRLLTTEPFSPTGRRFGRRMRASPTGAF
jgi:hypothetical protein